MVFVMNIFVSTYTNKIDAKKRISVPASYRAIIENESPNSNILVVYRSIINNCYEGCSLDRLQKIGEKINQLEPLSEEREYLSYVYLSSSLQIAIDNEGRVVFPKNILQDLKLSDNAIFSGKGEVFEIWNPQEFEEYAAKSRQKALENRAKLRF
jgi:MraZ protein